MVEGWDRVCPDCGNNDGARVARIAFHPTFECEVCGYVWDGSRATFLGLWGVGGDASEAELDALVDAIFNAVTDS